MHVWIVSTLVRKSMFRFKSIDLYVHLVGFHSSTLIAMNGRPWVRLASR